MSKQLEVVYIQNCVAEPFCVHCERVKFGDSDFTLNQISGTFYFKYQQQTVTPICRGIAYLCESCEVKLSSKDNLYFRPTKFVHTSNPLTDSVNSECFKRSRASKRKTLKEQYKVGYFHAMECKIEQLFQNSSQFFRKRNDCKDWKFKREFDTNLWEYHSNIQLTSISEMDFVPDCAQHFYFTRMRKFLFEV